MSGPSSTRQPCELGKSLRNCWLLPSFVRHTSVERTPTTTIFVIFPPAGTRTQKPSEESQLRASDAIVKNSNNGTLCVEAPPIGALLKPPNKRPIPPSRAGSVNASREGLRIDFGGTLLERDLHFEVGPKEGAYPPFHLWLALPDTKSAVANWHA